MIIDMTKLPVNSRRQHCLYTFGNQKIRFTLFRDYRNQFQNSILFVNFALFYAFILAKQKSKYFGFFAEVSRWVEFQYH